MIRALRNRHRLFFWILSPLLLAVFFAGLLARRPIPVMAALPDSLEAPVIGALIWENADLWPEHQIMTRLYAAAAGDGFVVEIQPDQALNYPDILAYWAPASAESASRSENGLPPGAILLGSLAGAEPKRFPLINRAGGPEGELLLYSLGHQRVAARTALPGAKGAKP